MAVEIRKIQQLIRLLERSNLAEIEVREGDDTVRIARQTSSHPVMMSAPAPVVAPIQVEVPGVATVAAPPASVPSAAIPPGHQVKSPMVGTVYLASSPTAPAFVTVGSQVKVGDVLCIIEAMKMMNQIESDRAGTVVAFLVENAKPIEFDQPLFVISE